MSEEVKVVFDTQIYLRAFINHKSICGRLFSNWTAYYKLHTCSQIEAEILDVLSRPSIRSKYPHINEQSIESVKVIFSWVRKVDISSEDILPISRDPKDDVFLACAKVANVDYLVSEDKDLLVLEQYHSSKIVNVAAFLAVLEANTKSDDDDSSP